MKIDQLILKYIFNGTAEKESKTYLRKNKPGEYIPPNIKTYFKANFTVRMCKNEQIDQHNRESRNRSSIYSHQNYEKDITTLL